MFGFFVRVNATGNPLLTGPLSATVTVICLPLLGRGHRVKAEGYSRTPHLATDPPQQALLDNRGSVPRLQDSSSVAPHFFFHSLPFSADALQPWRAMIETNFNYTLVHIA